MSEHDTMPPASEPVGAPVEQPVRPCAWIEHAALERLRSGSPRVRLTTELRQTPDDCDVPLYDRAAVDAAVAAERELCAATCERVAEAAQEQGERCAALDCAGNIRLRALRPNAAGNRLARQGQSELTGLLGGPTRSEKE